MAHMFVISRAEEICRICNEANSKWKKSSREPIFPYKYQEIIESVKLLKIYIGYIVETRQIWLGKRLDSMVKGMNLACKALYRLIYKRRKHSIYLKPLLTVVKLRKKIMYLNVS